MRHVTPVLLLVLALAACGGDGGPDGMPYTSSTYWSMQPDGKTIPAPRCLTVGPDDTVLCLDTVGRVLLYGADGKPVRTWRMPEAKVGRPEGADFLKDGRIAVADTHYHRVVFFDAEGKVVAMRGKHGSGDGEYIYPVAVVEDPSENLYVCEYGGNDRIQKFAKDGRFIMAFGANGTGPGEFQRPSGIVWHEGKLYVADAINNRVQVFSDTGEFVSVLGDPEALGLHFPYDLAIGKDRALYVVEYGANRVTKLDLDGKLLGRYGTGGQGDGQLRTPWGVAVDSQLRLRIADTGNRRIIALTP